MAKLTREDVLKLARLSSLSLNDKEVELFKEELDAILNYVEQLNKVDTKNLAPTSQVTGLYNVYREDNLEEYEAKADDILKLSPEVVDRNFKVKRVIE